MKRESAEIPGEEFHLFKASHRNLQRYQSYADCDYLDLVDWMKRTIKDYRAMPQRQNSSRVIDDDGFAERGSLLRLFESQTRRSTLSGASSIFAHIGPLTFSWGLGRNEEQRESLPKLPPSGGKEVSEPGKMPGRCSRLLIKPWRCIWIINHSH